MSETPDRLTTVGEIAAAIEAWAPPASAQSYDNVGLQIGRSDRPVKRALIALDATPAVLEQAKREHIELVITHHPLIFRPLRSLTPSSLPGGLALAIAEQGIALYAAHTNLDAAHGGVSFALARSLGLKDVTFLQRTPDTLHKLVTFVPADHADSVREALARAGAGRIGEYDACAFVSAGTGFFRAGDAANPFIGKPGGGIERADERRIEVEVARWDLARAIAAMKSVHPYEEVAYDVYPVAQASSRNGMGAVGDLEAPEPLSIFLERVATGLQTPALRFAGEPAAEISRVAVCGGSGGDLVSAAQSAGAHVFVTADVTYHRFFESMDQSGVVRMAIVDAGHYETEAMAEELLRSRLAPQFPAVEFVRASSPTTPVKWHLSQDRL